MSESDWGEHYKRAPTTPRNYSFYFNLTFTKVLAAEMMLFAKIEINFLVILPVPKNGCVKRISSHQEHIYHSPLLIHDSQQKYPYLYWLLLQRSQQVSLTTCPHTLDKVVSGAQWTTSNRFDKNLIVVRILDEVMVKVLLSRRNLHEHFEAH